MASETQKADATLAPPQENKEYGSVTPSDVSMMDEKRHSTSDDERDENLTPLEPVESSMYPSSWKLMSILLAIILSIFLVALDMVRTKPCMITRPDTPLTKSP